MSSYIPDPLAEAQAKVKELEAELVSTKLELTKATLKLHQPLDLYPANSWHEEMGDVLWWRIPVEESPYVGSPLDTNWDYSSGYTHYSSIPKVEEGALYSLTSSVAEAA